jgi:hypothetical protein
MGVSFHFQDDLLEVTVVSDHTVEEFFECIEAAQADTHWQGSAWLLIDVTQSPAVTRRTPQEIRRIVEFLVAQPGSFRHAVALLVSSTVQDEITRLAASMADFVGTEVRAFFHRDEAVRWLRGKVARAPVPFPPAAGRPPAHPE